MHLSSRNLATITFAIATYACVVSPVRARLSRRNRRWELSPVHRSVATSLVEDREDSSQGNGTKYVFMHHIVGNTYSYSEDDWKQDLQAISAKGVDALALNIGVDSWQPDQVQSAYDAAKGTDFKLFISFDYTSFPCSADSTISLVQKYSSHPNQFIVDGKPMISSYYGDCLGVDGWKNIQTATNGYLMPFLSNTDGQFAGDWSFLNSWYCWGCAWPQENKPPSTDDDNHYMQQLGSRYATTVSGWMFTHLASKNFYLPGDDWLINSRWDALIGMRDQLTFVEMVTWNDYGESDYFGPFKGSQPDGTYWAEKFPHTAWFDMSQYYITAFKTGSYPAITTDVVYFWARPHPASATASADPLPKPDHSDWTTDDLWAAVFATSDCSITLSIGSSSQTFDNVKPGVTKLKVSLAVGSINVKMTRGGQTVIDYSPTDFAYDAQPSQYNYNAYVGAATADGAGSSSTSSSGSSAFPTLTSSISRDVSGSSATTGGSSTSGTPLAASSVVQGDPSSLGNSDALSTSGAPAISSSIAPEATSVFTTLVSATQSVE